MILACNEYFFYQSAPAKSTAHTSRNEDNLIGRNEKTDEDDYLQESKNFSNIMKLFHHKQLKIPFFDQGGCEVYLQLIESIRKFYLSCMAF